MSHFWLTEVTGELLRGMRHAAAKYEQLRRQPGRLTSLRMSVTATGWVRQASNRMARAGAADVNCSRAAGVGRLFTVQDGR